MQRGRFNGLRGKLAQIVDARGRIPALLGGLDQEHRHGRNGACVLIDHLSGLRVLALQMDVPTASVLGAFVFDQGADGLHGG